jgi:hypothetical protein
VALHELVFVLGEPRRLGQEDVWDGDLADVVEEAAEADGIQVLARHAELLRDGDANPWTRREWPAV